MKSITEAIEKFETQYGELNPLQFLLAAEKFAQDEWPHRAFDMTSQNRQDALLFVKAVLVRKCKKAGIDTLKKATMMQTEYRKAMNHHFGSYAALTVIEKIIFELEYK